MKLNKIATAVSISLAALALTACGSDKKASNPSTPAPGGKPDTSAQVEKEQANIIALTKAAQKDGLSSENAAKFAHENKTLVVDSEAYKKAVEAAVAKQNATANTGNGKDPVSPAVEKSNPFIDGYDASKVSSVSGGHYARQNDSTFDRPANPTQDGSSGYSTTITTNKQNPYLTNYVLGSESFSKDKDGFPNRDAVDVVGAYVINATTVSTAQQAKSKDTVFDYTVVRHDGTTEKEMTENHYHTLQKENADNVEVAVRDVTEVFKAVKSGRVDAGGVRSGLEAYSSVSSSTLPVYGVAENTYVNKDGELKLVEGMKAYKALNNKQEAAGLDRDTSEFADDAANIYTTRIFGKNYQTLDNGAKIYTDKTNNNSYVALYQEGTGVLTSLKLSKLHNVQYGRITTNIDTLADDPKDPEHKKLNYVYREFEEHGSDASVDRYFYRGTNETSVDDMKKVVAKGGTLQYFGHALTYGLGPQVSDTGARVIPTAFGPSSPATIGNFVQAKYDTKAGKITGSVYNLVTEDVSIAKPIYKKQDLATFIGDVHGNTAAGQSTKLGANEKGSFSASFYGTQADELGGQISSITREQGYGAPKWGAVFGATQLSSGANYNTGAVGNTAGGNSSNATAGTTK